MKIKVKFLLAFFLIILMIGPGIGIVTYSLSNRVIIENTQQLAFQITDQIAINMEYLADNFEKVVFNLISDGNVDDLTFIDMIHKLNSGVYEYYVRRALENLFSTTVSLNDLPVERIYIRSSLGTIYCWERIDSRLTLLDQNQFGAMKNIMGAFVSLPSERYGQLWMRDNLSPDKNVLYGKEIIDVKTLEHLGDLVFVFKEQGFNLVRDDNYLIKRANIAIINQKEQIIIANEIFPVESLVQYVLDNELLNSHIQFARFSYDRENYIFSRVKSNNQYWQILCFISMPELMRNSNYLKISVFFFCLLAMLVSLGFAFLFSSGLTKNIYLLERNMKKAEKGDFSVAIQPVGLDEIGYLALSFNSMIREIKTLMDKVYQEQKEKHVYEYKMLAAQINPHFLYNTLGSIKWMSHRQQQQEIEDMVSAMIQLLKISSQETNFISVNEEINYIRNYIVLQKIRYENQFSVFYELDADSGHYYTFKLLLQPLVENALFHGLDMSKGKGIIIIRVKIVKKNLELEIEDNGIGMDQESVDKLLNPSVNSTHFGFNSIGIRNVNERIKLYFGSEYGLFYRSAPNKGTTATVKIPLIESMEEVEIYDKGIDRGR